MKRSILIVLQMCVCIPLLCSSCSLLGTDPVGQMRPPRPAGEFAGVEDALKQAVGKDVRLVYPKSGDYRSAYVLKDLDGDGEKEALAFYTPTTDGSATHLNLLDRVDDEWKSMADLKLESTGIDSVQTAALTDAGAVNILLGCSLYSTQQKQLNVFAYENGGLNSLYKEIYTEFSCYDFNGDGLDELMMVNLNTVQQVTTASMVSLAGGKQRQMGTADLDPMITGIASIRVSPVGERMGAYIDSYKGASAMVTDIVCLNEEGALMNPVFDPGRKETLTTFRQSASPCQDIDGDGVLEIPSLTVMLGYENAAAANRPYITLWRRYDGVQFEVVMTCVMNYVDGYYFELPEAWVGNVTLDKSLGDRSRVFYQWDFSKSQKGAELLALQVFTQTEWNTGEHKDFSQLGIRNDLVYAYRLGKDAGELGISAQEVASKFRFI